jgi:hypothetical protein
MLLLWVSYSATNWQKEVCHFQNAFKSPPYVSSEQTDQQKVRYFGLNVDFLEFAHIFSTVEASLRYCPSCAATLKARGWRCHRLGPVIAARSFNYYYYYYFFYDLRGTFGALNMLKNSWNFAHGSEPAVIRAGLKLVPGRGRGARQRPLEQGPKTWSITQTRLHVIIWNSVHI